MSNCAKFQMNPLRRSKVIARQKNVTYARTHTQTFLRNYFFFHLDYIFEHEIAILEPSILDPSQGFINLQLRKQNKFMSAVDNQKIFVSDVQIDIIIV